MADVLWCVLKGLESCDEDVSEKEETVGPFVVFAEAAEDPCCDEFAEGGARPIDVLAVGGTGLFFQELGAVDHEAVNCRRLSMDIIGRRLASLRFIAFRIAY
jgi:hypothetical protein